jgi:hypothetical protein
VGFSFELVDARLKRLNYSGEFGDAPTQLSGAFIRFFLSVTNPGRERHE